MKQAILLVLGILLLQPMAFADVLRFKSGETKRGRILAESKGRILFQDVDGTISEAALSAISILDRGNVSGNKGQVSFYTTSPRKKKKSTARHPQLFAAPEESSVKASSKMSTGQDPQELSLRELKKLMGLWLEQHPESREWLEAAAKEDSLKSIDIEGVLAEIKK